MPIGSKPWEREQPTPPPEPPARTPKDDYADAKQRVTARESQRENYSKSKAGILESFKPAEPAPETQAPSKDVAPKSTHPWFRPIFGGKK